MKPSVAIVTVTPELAAKWLAEHDRRVVAGITHQRKITDSIVDKYYLDYKTGNWAFTGQGVSFDTDGNLLNGQHSLYALVKAGATVDMVVTTGIPATHNGHPTINYIDVGKNRSVSNQLHINGMLYSSLVANTASSIINCCFAIRQNTVSNPRRIEIATVVEPHMSPLLQLLVHQPAKYKYTGRVLAPLVLLRTWNRAKATEFATSLAEMTGLSKYSPVLQLDRFLQRPLLTARSGHQAQMLAFKAISSALFCFVEGKEAEILRGNDEHMEWLLLKARPFLTTVKNIIGEQKNIRYLESK